MTLLTSPGYASSKDRLVSSIVFKGLDRVDEQRIKNLIQATVGEMYDASIVKEDVRTLTHLGEFKYISADVVLQEDGTVELIYTSREQQIITQVSVVGNTSMSDQKLLSLIPKMVGLTRDQRSIDSGKRSIIDVYKEQGNYLVEVFPEVIVYGKERDEFTDLEIEESVVLIYKIMEGPRVLVKGLSFLGNHSFTDQELKAEIDTNVSVPFLRRGELNEQVVDADVSNLKRFYISQGFWEVRVSYTNHLSPNNKEAAVVFLIEEGPQYTIGGISTEFVTFGKLLPVFTEEQIRGLIPMKQGDVFRQSDINASVNAINNAYGVLGRIINVVPRQQAIKKARKTANVIPYHAEPGATIDVLFVITEGRPTRVGIIDIKGNELTEDHVIRGRIGLKPGYPFDVAEANRSEERLMKTGLFNKVAMTIQAENPNNLGYRDLLIEVREQHSGSLNFGLMAGTEGGIIINFSIHSEISPSRTSDEILDAIYTPDETQHANSLLLPLEQAWLSVCQIRTELLSDEIDRDDMRKRIDEMIGWIMSADEPANLERRFAAAKPIKREFDAERLALLGVTIAFAEAVNDVALAKKSIDFSFVILNDSPSKQQKYCLPFLIAGCIKPARPINDSAVCDEVFADLQSWLVNDTELFQSEHLPWLDFVHVYLLSMRNLPIDALAALPSLNSSVPDEPLFLLLQPPLFSKYRTSGPYTSQLSQRWVFDTIHALTRYSLATEEEEKEQSKELLGLQFDEIPKELSDDFISRLKKLTLPPVSSLGHLENNEKRQFMVLHVLLQEIKTKIIEENISDARSFLDLVLSEDFRSKAKTMFDSIPSEGNQ